MIQSDDPPMERTISETWNGITEDRHALSESCFSCFQRTFQPPLLDFNANGAGIANVSEDGRAGAY